MHVVTANGCAWRAFYVFSGTRAKPGPMCFSLGLDPTFRYNQAKLFGSIGHRMSCQGVRNGGWSWDLWLPKSRHWWKLDGRRGMRT